MKGWAKVAIGAGVGLAAFFIFLRRGAPQEEQPPAVAKAEIMSISYEVA